MSENDGGPAFPTSQKTRDTTGKHAMVVLQSGMSLRDYFAAQALTSIPNRCWDHLNDREVVDAWTSVAYAVADAMLAEREKGKPHG